MPYNPNNNPYIPGDPYSYDLKWVVQKMQDLVTQVNSLYSSMQSYIDAWLTAHPEATTTVVDGSITMPKFSADVAERVDALENPFTDTGLILNAKNALDYPVFQLRSLKVNNQGGIAVGTNAGAVNEGEANTFIGDYAGKDNTTGRRNTAVGTFAEFSKTVGQYNTAVGYVAESYNTTGDYNTAIGYGALETNVSGGGNTSIGGHSLSANELGNDNTAVGYFSLYNSKGSNNTAIGDKAGMTLATGGNNTFAGYQADSDGNATTEGVAIGHSAQISGTDNIAIGHGAVAIGTDYGISIGSLPAQSRETNIGHYLTDRTKIHGALMIPTHLSTDPWITTQNGFVSIFLSQDGDLKIKYADGTIKTFVVS